MYCGSFPEILTRSENERITGRARGCQKVVRTHESGVRRDGVCIGNARQGVGCRSSRKGVADIALKGIAVSPATVSIQEGETAQESFIPPFDNEGV